MNWYKYTTIAIAVGLFGSFGCGDDAPSSAGELDCGPGENTDVDGVAACVISNELLIETGFMCDPRLQRYEGDQITVCAEEPLSEEQLGEVEGFRPPPDPGSDPIVLGTSDIEGNQCIDGGEPGSTPASLTLADAGEEEDGHEVNVVHEAFEANCCVVFEDVSAIADPNTNTVTVEYDINTDDPCDCICLFNLDYKVTGVPAGTWTFQVGETSASIALP